MLSLKCDNCGAEMSVSSAGDLLCPYCGTKSSFSDAELLEYKAFRRRLLEYLAAVSDNKQSSADDEAIWSMAEAVSFPTNNGPVITVNHLFKATIDDVEMYMARRNIVTIFDRGAAPKRDTTVQNIQKITFPRADSRHLEQCVPQIAGSYELTDGRQMLIFSKNESFYPLALFGNLPYEHTAWVVSRMENIACLLEYNDLVHNGFSPDTLFINPKTHEAALLGAWWLAEPMNAANSTKDLLGLRQVAKDLLKPTYADIPPMFKKFLEEKPADDAFADFSKWDYVIENGLGGRKFHKLELGVRG